MERVTVGRSVHFVDNNGDHLAATVCWVYPETGTVNLTVHSREGLVSSRGSVPFDQKGEQPTSWHWPERDIESPPAPPPIGFHASRVAGEPPPATATPAVPPPAPQAAEPAAG